MGLLWSVLFHGVVLLTTPFWSSTFWELDQILANNVEEAIERNERNKRVIWYRVPTMPAIRDIQAADRGSVGSERSREELIVNKPDARSKSQSIEQLNASRVLEREIETPNVIRRAPAAESPARPVRKMAPIPETSPRPMTQVAERQMERPPEIASAENANNLFGNLAIARLAKPVPKKAVIPQSTASARTPSEQFNFESVPNINTTTNPGLGGPGLEKVPKLPARRFKAPPTEGGPGTRGEGKLIGELPTALEDANAKGATGSGGRDTTDIAVIGLNPGFGQLPKDARLPGRFSRAPQVGPPQSASSGDAKAIPMAGVSAKSNGSNPNGDLRLIPPEVILGEEATEGYFEIRLDLARQWPRLSLPISPNRRALPRRIEPFFRGRVAFAIVIPMEKIYRYSGDWIVWFAPKGEGSDAASMVNARVEAPLPIWKLESRKWFVGEKEQAVEQRVQVVTAITVEGRVVIKDLLDRFDSNMNRLITNDLSRWVFQPARVAGKAVEVDAVMEIPFRIPPSLATGHR